MKGVRILPAEEQDWEAFFRWATAEGWRIPANEVTFHRRLGAGTALALRRGEEPLGFVTAVPHQRSGWIGNLLIAPQERGRGYGARLFDFAVQALRMQGVASLWLTASAQGEPLYRRRGFQPRGRVRRWIRAEGGEGRPEPTLSGARQGLAADREIWQESRAVLLTHLSATGTWLTREGDSVLLQRLEHQQIIGPWIGSGSENSLSPLLEELIALADSGKELVMDWAGPPEEAFLWPHFTCVGETLLMGSGPCQAVCLDRLHALASLGSIG